MATSGLASVAESVVRVARSEGRQILLEHEALEVVRGMGLRTPHHLVAEDVPALGSLALDEFPGGRVVVKALSPALLHKTERGAVAVVPRRPVAVARAAREMEARLAPGLVPDGFLVEEYVPHRSDPGGELLLGVRWTREFGAVVSLGLGGTAVEALARGMRPGEAVASFSAGVDPEEVARGLRGRTLTTLATGAARGAPIGPSPTRLALLVEDALDWAVRCFPDPFVEIEVNPLTFTARGPMALDAVVRLAPPGRPANGPRPPPPPGGLAALLEPRTVALVGASDRPNPGRVILRNLLAQGFPAEDVTVVRPGGDGLEGCPGVSRLADLNAPVDLLVVAVPARGVPALLEVVVEGRLARSVVLIPGGLGERAGTGDRARSIRNILGSARASGDPGAAGRRHAPVVNGGNCLGVRSVPGRVNTLFIPDSRLRFPADDPAPLAVVSQSGAFAVALGSRLPEVNPRHLVTVGNQVDLTVGDWLDHLAGDPAVTVFACYVEGFEELDGVRFLDAARRIRRAGRAVVVYRAGRSDDGARAAASHTASVAGDWALTRELCVAAGALWADTLDEFRGLVRISLGLADRHPGGLGLGALSNAGFEAVAVADRAAPLRLASLGAGTRERVHALLAARGLTGVVGVRNPLDVTPMLDDEGFARATRALLEDPAVDVAAVGCVPLTPALATIRPDEERPGDVADGPNGIGTRLEGIWRESTKPWVMAVDAGPAYDPMVARLRSAGLPVFRSVDRAVGLLARWTEWRLGAGRA